MIKIQNLSLGHVGRTTQVGFLSSNRKYTNSSPSHLLALLQNGNEILVTSFRYEKLMRLYILTKNKMDVIKHDEIHFIDNCSLS
jgi:hypothetical protein